VVGIYTTQRVKTGYVQRGPYHYRPRVEERPGLGSGFVIDEEGYILTNSHVVSQADSIRIRTADDRTFSAEVVGIDPLTDLAIVKVEPYDGITALSFGDSDKVDVGDWLVAVGNPYGLSFSVTAGILSGRGRRDIPIEGPIRYVDFLQTDASINPGNSGGPLVDMNGDVIGITTAMNQSAQGIGFAIPSNMAKTIYEELRESGRVERSWIGVRIAEVPKRLQESEDVTGALVTHVARGGPAARAGVRPGDVITRFADQKISESDELPWLASTAGVGAEVDVEVYRDGQNVRVSLVLGQMPN
jgi:S1-C subfamily serine protease